VWQTLKKFFPDASADNAGGQDVELAVAALLVRASVMDEHPSPVEARRIETVLAERFKLPPEALARLMAEARAAEADAIDIYRFTRVITEHFDQEGRQSLIEMLWEVVLADGQLDPFEENLVWRVAELVGVSTRDRVLLRKAVEAKLTASGRPGPWG
jgi:uncharacterized tellurite resistance protein B-like protein